MSELCRQNSALRASEVLKNFMGRLGLSPTDTAEPERADNDLGNSSSGLYAEVTPELLAEVKQAVAEQLVRDSLSEPDAVDPLEVGAQRAQDHRLWSADLSAYLVSQGYPDQQGKPLSRTDPEYRRALESMLARGIPGRGL